MHGIKSLVFWCAIQNMCHICLQMSAARNNHTLQAQCLFVGQKEAMLQNNKDLA